MSGPERDRMRVAVLDEASIVCSTLSFAGSAMFYRMTRKFDVVIIDEVIRRCLSKVPREKGGRQGGSSSSLLKSVASECQVSSKL